jgi:hypothetical protein
MFAALARDGDLRLLRRMTQCRELAHDILAWLMADVPDLVAAGELQVQDITGEIKQDANFAITHGGKVIKDGFATQAAARLYIQRCLIAPAQLMLEHEAIGDQFTIHAGAGPKSWSVH